MASFYTYSFEDTTLTINHPSKGSYSAFGTGLGSITISMTNDITTHDVAADLSVVVSKSVKKNGTISLSILQSSSFNNWLMEYYKYVTNAAASEFALATVVIRNNSTGRSYTCTGVSPQKLPDDNYQDTSQNRAWVLMAANIVAE